MKIIRVTAMWCMSCLAMKRTWKKVFKEIPDLILKSGWIKQDGIFILEHSAEFKFADHPSFSYHRKFGNVNFTFFKAL